MVSSVWHGLYAGYFLFFAGSAVWLHASGVSSAPASVRVRASAHDKPYRHVHMVIGWGLWQELRRVQGLLSLLRL